MAKTLMIICGFSLFAVSFVNAWNDQNNEAVLLRDINVLTLHHDRMSTARRSSPVPQLKCVGGDAGCSFVPKVVQCYNRGWDGYDVQWECKSDMDNAYRFGKVEVTCEGYNYPDDPYILKGSCGLEYTIDLTQEGHQQKQSGYQSQHSYHGDDTYGYASSQKKSSSFFGDLLVLVIIGVVIYAIYVMCLSNGNNIADRGAPPPYPAHDDHSRPRGNPPPYGFRNDYMPNNDDADCSRNRTQTNYGSQPAGSGSTGGGFWTGAGLGGMLGYMFGSRTNTGYGRPYGHNAGYGSSWWNGEGSTWGRGYGSSGWGSSYSTPRTTTRTSFGGGGGGASSGTRSASGFGGTRRR